MSPDLRVAFQLRDKIYILMRDMDVNPGEACNNLCDAQHEEICDMQIKGCSCSELARAISVKSVYLKEVT